MNDRYDCIVGMEEADTHEQREDNNVVFTIHVGSPERVGEGVNAYAEYKLTVTTNLKQYKRSQFEATVQDSNTTVISDKNRGDTRTLIGSESSWQSTTRVI